MSNYVVYIAPDCHECESVSTFLLEKKVDVPIIKLEDSKEWLDKGLFVFPVLVNGEEVIAYGWDIVEYLI